MTVQIEAISHGPQEPPLLDWNTAGLLDFQSISYGEEVAVVSLHQNERLTYSELRNRIRKLAGRLLQNGTKPGDRIVLLAGNSIEFVVIFLATAAIGAISVITTTTSSADEFREAVNAVGKQYGTMKQRRRWLTERAILEPQSIFLAHRIGYRSNADIVQWAGSELPGHTIVIGSDDTASLPEGCVPFNLFLTGANAAEHKGDADLKVALNQVWGQTPASSACCFQFTSGTTGARKASMLSHM